MSDEREIKGQGYYQRKGDVSWLIIGLELDAEKYLPKFFLLHLIY